MCGRFPDRAAIHSSINPRWLLSLQVSESTISMNRDWAAGELHERIHTTLPGRMRSFGVTQITWKLRSSTSGLKHYLIWWRCHRSLIADYLKAAGHEVIHILDAKKSEEHPYTSAARIVDGKLSYQGLLK
jgi:hypothetical protein